MFPLSFWASIKITTFTSVWMRERGNPLNVNLEIPHLNFNKIKQAFGETVTIRYQQRERNRILLSKRPSYLRWYSFGIEFPTILVCHFSIESLVPNNLARCNIILYGISSESIRPTAVSKPWDITRFGLDGCSVISCWPFIPIWADVLKKIRKTNVQRTYNAGVFSLVSGTFS